MLVVGSVSYGSVSTGARLAAVVSVAMAVFAPMQGRWMDLRGVSRGLRSALWLAGLAGVAMAAVVHLGLGAPWIELVAAALGFTLAIIPAGFRALLTEIVDSGSLERASNLDAVGFEISLISAPLLVAAVTAVASPATIFLVGAALTAVGAAAVPRGTGEGRRAGAGRRLRLPVPGIMVVGLLLGVSGGLLEPALFARVEDIGRTESLAAVLLAVVGVGSALGGLAASARPLPASAARWLLVFHGSAVAAVAFSDAPVTLGAWLLVAGVPIAPLMAVGATVIDRRVAQGQRSTAFALAGSAIALGTGIGQALAGWMLATQPALGPMLASAGLAVLTAASLRPRRLP